MTRRSAPLLATLAAMLGLVATPAVAVSPRNPYRSFNLSGINYGSMQWERAQRSRSSGTTRSRSVQGTGFVSAGGTSGLLIQRATPARRMRRR